MSRRQPTKAERDALRVWCELAGAEPGAPIPQHMIDLARAICRLALSGGTAKQAAAACAGLAGLTGRAIADFRAEQRALLTSMAFEFNRGQPRPDKSTIVAGEIADVGERQVYKRRKRLR